MVNSIPVIAKNAHDFRAFVSPTLATTSRYYKQERDETIEQKKALDIQYLKLV